MRPTEVNWTIAGTALATVKSECGARFSTPSAEIVETHAIGRGTMTEVMHSVELHALLFVVWVFLPHRSGTP